MKLKIMGKTENDESVPKPSTSSGEGSTSKSKPKSQGKKRKRSSSESSNDDQIILPDNALETERNVHASALKNNLDETSVRKIIKKVVTNDHVLALVKLREEEEACSPDYKKPVPKLTRAKVKELKKVSTCKSAAWDLEKLELTPIKHIPVKTRPEVKALIAQELPEDEDDDEYEPTHDDVPSDDDHVESCSDLDSQPRTPATPAKTPSPRVVKDGPFKVPQDISKARRKLEIEEEEATIALRTRSKLSLSSTSIEYIESNFVPPDDLPIQDVDDLWNEFLNECLNPGAAVRHDDDDETLDETDPEYNVAADPDAHDEDEETLSNSIIKISKKELNDLVTELFSILPENAEEDLANSVLTDTSQTIVPQFEGKQEPLSDDETRENPSKKLRFEREHSPEKIKSKASVHNGKKKEKEINQSEKSAKEKVAVSDVTVERMSREGQDVPCLTINGANRNIEISIQESKETAPASVAQMPPPSLRDKIKPTSETVCIQIENNVTVSKEQLLILQQQIRQHVQLATSTFMQTVVHPVHWQHAPNYKEYLESLMKLAEKNPDSVVNVCNLKPSYELIIIWEKSVTVDTEENRKMIEFMLKDIEKCRRRISNNNLYSGEFHEMFMKVVANSTVFLYPHLLPSIPFRPDAPRKAQYCLYEDTLIVLGLDQFWSYVKSNPQIFHIKGGGPRSRPGLSMTLVLVSKHMFPWLAPNKLRSHVSAVRLSKDELNPIYRYFKYHELPNIEHTILPYNPKLTLYEQPEYEMPRAWARYLAISSRRFKKYLKMRTAAVLGRLPAGVKIDPQTPGPIKTPLPIAFTKKIESSRAVLSDKSEPPTMTNRLDVNVQRVDQNAQSKAMMPQNFFRLVQTGTGSFMLPLQISVDPNSNMVTGPITPELRPNLALPHSFIEHCECCSLLRKICKVRQSLITDYFVKDKDKKSCYCNSMSFPKITNKLQLLVKNSKKESEIVLKELDKRITDGEIDNSEMDLTAKDVVHILSYQVKVYTQLSLCNRINIKKKVSNLLSGFDTVNGDPVVLAIDLYTTFRTELLDLFLDFLPFLTPEQADKVAGFQDYFIRNCVKDLMKKIEEEVSDKATRLAILLVLKSTISSRLSACTMCTKLLRVMEGYQELARYTFHLFPHTRENRPILTSPVELTSVTASASAAFTCPTIPQQTRTNGTNNANESLLVEHHSVDYEADHSSSGEENAMSGGLSRPPEPVNSPSSVALTEEMNIYVKAEPDPEFGIPTSSRLAEDSDSEHSLSIDESEIKQEIEETIDWTKEEDRTILKVLQQHLTKEERRERTIIDILEEKNVYGMLFDSLNRSIIQIKKRVLYLLTLLVVSENDS